MSPTWCSPARRRDCRNSRCASRSAPGRWRLVRQLLVENVILASLGGLCGLLLARWATGLLVTFMSSGRTPIVLHLEPDARILAFTAVVSILTGILCGLVPALRASRVDVVSGIKGQARGSIGGGHWLGPGKILVVSQVVLCLLLLFGAGLFVRSLRATRRTGCRFRSRDRCSSSGSSHEAATSAGVPGASERLDRTYRDLLQRVESIPGVRAASLAHFSPTSRVGYAGPVRLPDGTQQRVPQMMVYPNYFATMDIAIACGARLLGTGPRRGLAARGRRQRSVRAPDHGRREPDRQADRRRARRQVAREIIGVVKDTRYASLKEETPPLIYQPFLQTNTGRGQMTLHVRISDTVPLAWCRGSARKCSASTRTCRSSPSRRWPIR